MKHGDQVYIDGQLPATLERPGDLPGLWWVRTATAERVCLPAVCLSAEPDAFMDSHEQVQASSSESVEVVHGPL